MRRSRWPVIPLAAMFVLAVILIRSQGGDSASSWSLIAVRNPGADGELVSLPGGSAASASRLAVGASDFSVAAGSMAYIFGADAAGAGALMRGATFGGAWQPVAECADRRCAMPALDSAGQKLAFVRTAQGTRAGAVLLQQAPGMPAGAAFGPDAPAMINPAWSHNGRYLAAYVPSLGELQVRDFEANEIVAVPAPSAEVFAWSGGATPKLAFATAQPAGESLVHRLWVADIQHGSVEPISELFMHPVTSMAWHPEHGSLAFSQRPNGGETSGRQLRVLDIRTGQTRDITQSSSWTYGGPAWSPDGSLLFAVRNINRFPPEAPVVVQIEVASGAERVVLDDATLPAVSHRAP